jgi:hypothetical protein
MIWKWTSALRMLAIKVVPQGTTNVEFGMANALALAACGGGIWPISLGEEAKGAFFGPEKFSPAAKKRCELLWDFMRRKKAL